MKTFITKLLALCSVALLLLPACKKDGTLVTSNGGKPGALTASATTLVLDKTKLSDPSPAITFSVTAPNYGFSAAVTNTLQIDAIGDNWANPTTVTLGAKVLSQGYSTAAFNSLLLKLNLVGGVSSTVNVRVAHSISANIAPVYSNVLTLTVTPFNLTSFLYVVGSFDGWPSLPAAGTDSLLSATSNGIYTGIINFPAGKNDFLILPQSNNYNNKYATNDPKNTTSSTVTVGANNNFFAPSAAGEYWVTLNINTNTISFAPADYYSIIGNAAQGWGTDVDMKYINDGNMTWVATTPLSVESPPNDGYKIRKNHDWGTSWGTIAPPDGTSLTSSSGVNIGNAVAGTYKITFWLNAADHTGVTAFYTAVKQ
jgi:hypothetical protein